MGDITELILEGVLCECCSVAIDGKETGYPRKCRRCSPQKRVHKCTQCDRKFASVASRVQHMKDKHGQSST